MQKNKDESKGDQIRYLLHSCNKYLFYHVGKGAQQNKALRLLVDGPKSQKDLQEQLGVQPASVSELISKLEGKGLVERSRSESDRRVVMLSLTEAGRNTERKDSKIISSEGLFSCLDEGEKDKLIELLDKLNKSFDTNDNNK